MTTLAITVSEPPKSLNPNARTHWAAKSRAVKAYRAEAKVAALAAMNGRKQFDPPKWEQAAAVVRFYFRTKHRHDEDNAKASLKAVWDGLVDAGVMSDDSGLSVRVESMGCDSTRPRVEIEICERT